MKYINNEFFTKVRGKLKLFKDKTMKKITILSLATVLLVSGCSVKQNSNITPSNNSNNSTHYTEQHETNTNTVTNSNATTPQPKPPVVVNTKLSEEELALLNQSVSMDQNSFNALSSYIHGISVEYEGSQYFQIDQALQRYQNMKEYETFSSNFIQNGKINEIALKQRVIENNNDYLENTSSKKYSQLDASTFNKVFSHLMDTLNYQLESGASIDLAQLDDNLSNLRIFRMTTQGSGMVTDDGIMAFNLEVIDTKQQQYPNVDYLRMTVLHEGNHLVQVSSVKERENEGYSRNLGIAYSWDDLRVNPLLYTWYVEGSAEYLKNYQFGYERTNNYENQVKSVEALALATILKEGVNETTLAQLSLQPDLNKLFGQFNCKTDADRLEVLQMMYSFEIFLNQPSEYSNFYKESTGHSLDTYNYHDSLKASIAQTLSKQFYENLGAATVSNHYTLKDIFSIMSTFEIEMNRITRFSNTSYIESNSGFISVYKDIQLQYFELISKSLNMSVDDLVSLYNTYYHDDISKVSQINTTESESIFLNEILQNRESNRKNTVNEIGNSKLK